MFVSINLSIYLSFICSVSISFINLFINLSSVQYQSFINISSVQYQPFINISSVQYQSFINISSVQYQSFINLSSVQYQSFISISSVQYQSFINLSSVQYQSFINISSVQYQSFIICSVSAFYMFRINVLINLLSVQYQSFFQIQSKCLAHVRGLNLIIDKKDMCACQIKDTIATVGHWEKAKEREQLKYTRTSLGNWEKRGIMNCCTCTWKLAYLEQYQKYYNLPGLNYEFVAIWEDTTKGVEVWVNFLSLNLQK